LYFSHSLGLVYQKKRRKSTKNITLFHFIEESFFNNFCYLAPVGTVPAQKASFFKELKS